MTHNLRDSVLLITGSDDQRFGTGFIIHKNEESSYVVTCNHVVVVVGEDELKVAGRPARVVARDSEAGFDLAVLCVDVDLNFPLLQLQNSVLVKNKPVMLAGGFDYGRQRLIQECTAILGDEVTITSQTLDARSTGWHLTVTGSNAEIKPGNSGAPVIDIRSGHVIGIVNQRKAAGDQGLVIPISTIEMIWKDMPENLLKNDLKVDTTCPPTAEPRMNLEDELAAFQRIATGDDTETRLILVHGASGMGKSYLLDLYKKVADGHFDSLDIALGPQISVEDCLERIVSHYGWEHFPNYDEAATNGITNPLTPSNEQQWWRTLTRKFFIDLESYKEVSPVTVFFDPYEKADYAFRSWMSDIFLPKISARCPIIIVIAGQEVVESASFGRICRHFHLNGVKVNWYHRYVKDCNAPLDPGEVELFFEALKGEPKRFVDLVSARLLTRGATQ